MEPKLKLKIKHLERGQLWETSAPLEPAPAKDSLDRRGEWKIPTLNLKEPKSVAEPLPDAETENESKITETFGKNREKIKIGDGVNWNYDGNSGRGSIASFTLAGLYTMANINMGADGEVEVFADELSLVTPEPAPTSAELPFEKGGIWKIPTVSTAPSQPVAETLPDAETGKAEVIAKLRETIANAQKVLAEEAEIREPIKKRLAEIREAKASTPIKKERIELPKDIKEILDEELEDRKYFFKRETEASKKDQRDIEFARARLELLESDPIKYWTEKKYDAKSGLDFVSNDPQYSKENTEEKKQERITHYTKKVTNLQKIIDALKAAGFEK